MQFSEGKSAKNDEYHPIFPLKIEHLPRENGPFRPIKGAFSEGKTPYMMTFSSEIVAEFVKSRSWTRAFPL